MRTSSRTWIVLAVVVAVSLGLVASSAAGQKKTWKVTLLDGPSSDSYGTLANDISDSGLVGGVWFDQSRGWHAATWYKGKAYDIETECGIPSDTAQSIVMSVNTAGLMAGNAYSNDRSVYGAILWNFHKGTYTDIHPDDWAASAAYGINASGAVVGWGITTDFEWHALLWEKDSQGGYEPTDLQDDVFASGYDQCDAYDVSESGAIYGILYDNYVLARVPYQWTEEDGLVELDDDDTGFGIAWKAVGRYVAGGIGHGRYEFGQAISDKAVVWVNGKLDVIVDELGGYTTFEASSVSRKGVAAGIAFKDGSRFPSAFVAEKK